MLDGQTDSTTTLDLFLPTSADRQAIRGHGGATRRPELAIRDDDNDDDVTARNFEKNNEYLIKHLMKTSSLYVLDHRLH